MQLSKVVGKHLKNKRYIFQWTFAPWWLWESSPKVFVCTKSNFNLVLLIDVAFYFKCLWRYPTTVLCGPMSNETHSRMPLRAIRSVASTQCSPWSVVYEGASTWWASCKTIEFSSSPGTSTSANVGEIEASTPNSRHYRAAVLVLSTSSSSGPSPRAHMEGFRRISTPEEGMKGSGASVQGSPWGLYIWSPLKYEWMCSDVLVWMSRFMLI